MNNEDKKKAISQDIANNYLSFRLQCNIKLKSYHVFKNLNADDLLSDILYSFFEKLEDPCFVDRMYVIFLNKKLTAFIGKSIDIQAKHIKGPFLQKVMKTFNKVEFKEVYSKIDEEEDYTEEDKEIYLAEEINDVIDRIEKQKLLGEYTFYYIDLLREYIHNDKITYRDLSEKYKISLATINRDMLYIKKCIIILLKERGLKFPKNRHSKFTTI